MTEPKRMAEVDIQAIRDRVARLAPSAASARIARLDIDALLVEVELLRSSERSWNKEAERHDRDHRDHYEERERLRAELVVSHNATAKAVNQRSALEATLRRIVESRAGEFRDLARAALATSSQTCDTTEDQT